MLNWITEGIRLLVWGLCSSLLFLMDMTYSSIKGVILIDFSNGDLLWKIVGAFEALIGLAILIRVCIMVFRIISDDDELMKFSITDFIWRFLFVAVAIAMLPIILGFAGKLTTASMDNMGYFIGTPTNQAPSTTIISAYTNSINGTDNTYTLSSVDINKRQPGDRNTYVFFPELTQLFIMCFIGIGAAVVMFLTTIDIAKRCYELFLLVSASPLPLSSFITRSNNSFSEWWKMIISIYTTNFAQVVMIMLTMVVMSSPEVVNKGVWMQIIFLIGGLLAALGGIPQIARLLGAEMGLSSTMQQIAHIRQASSGLVRGTVGGIGAGLMGMKALGGNVGSKVAYGAGRMLGGVSSSQYNAATNFSNTGAKLNSPSSRHGQALARQSTTARSVANAAYAMKPGFARAVAVDAVKSTGHIYEKSMNKYSQSTVSKGVNMYRSNRNTSPYQKNRNQGGL